MYRRISIDTEGERSRSSRSGAGSEGGGADVVATRRTRRGRHRNARRIATRKMPSSCRTFWKRQMEKVRRGHRSKCARDASMDRQRWLTRVSEVDEESRIDVRQVLQTHQERPMHHTIRPSEGILSRRREVQEGGQQHHPIQRSLPPSNHQRP